MSLVSIIYVFLAIVLIRFILNYSKYLFLKKAITKHDIFARSHFKNASESDKKDGEKAGSWLEARLIEISKSVLNAGIHDIVHSFMKPVGYNHVQEQKMSVLENLLYYKDVNTLLQANDLMRRAKGYYWFESIKSINPIFWIEFIVFLPKEIVNYFASGNESKSLSIVTKIIQLLYWIASLIVIFITNKAEITNLFQN